jgi:hypothetical protein
VYIPFVIPVGRTYQVRVKGSTQKEIRCEHCGNRYSYQMDREGAGEDFSPLFLNNAGAKKRAEEKAQAELQRQLKTGTDAVPCPACQRMQETMVTVLRRQAYPWMTSVARPMLFFMLAVVVVAWVCTYSAIRSSGQ